MSSIAVDLMIQLAFSITENKGAYAPSAAVTLSGIELAHRIRKRQFRSKPGERGWSARGRSLKQMWDRVLAAEPVPDQTDPHSRAAAVSALVSVAPGSQATIQAVLDEGVRGGRGLISLAQQSRPIVVQDLLQQLYLDFNNFDDQGDVIFRRLSSKPANGAH